MTKFDYSKPNNSVSRPLFPNTNDILDIKLEGISIKEIRELYPDLPKKDVIISINKGHIIFKFI